MIIATRNRLVHAYLGIDDDTIWSVIQDEAGKAGFRPEILEKVDRLLDLLDLLDCVDPFSLCLSLRIDTDERGQSALQQMMEDEKWRHFHR
jgi:hypothetical protein